MSSFTPAGFIEVWILIYPSPVYLEALTPAKVVTLALSVSINGVNNISKSSVGLFVSLINSSAVFMWIKSNTFPLALPVILSAIFVAPVEPVSVATPMLV